MSAIPLSVFIICQNEADRIVLVLESIRDIADEIIIIDSGSTDGTLELVRTYTDKIYHKDWEGFGAQKKYGETLCKNHWILNLDADEVLLEEVKNSIRLVFELPEDKRASSYSLDIRHVSFMSKNMTPKPFGPRNITPRLYNKKKAGFKDSTVHDKVVNFDSSKPIILKGAVAHISTKSFSHMWEKIRIYSELQAQKWVNDGRKVTYFQLVYDPLFFFFKNFFIRRLCFIGVEGLVMSIALSAGRALRIGMALEIKRKQT